MMISGDAQQVLDNLREVKAAVEAETNNQEAGGKRFVLHVSGGFEDDSEVHFYGRDQAKILIIPLDTGAESVLSAALNHHLPAIIETALGLAGAVLMEAKAKAALEAAAVLKELQPVEDLAEGA